MVTRGNEVITEPGNHSHEADVIQVKKDILLSNVREIAKAGESTTRNIIGGTAAVATNDVLVRLQVAVRAYADEDDVLRYLRSIAHMQVP